MIREVIRIISLLLIAAVAGVAAYGMRKYSEVWIAVSMILLALATIRFRVLWVAVVGISGVAIVGLALAFLIGGLMSGAFGEALRALAMLVGILGGLCISVAVCSHKKSTPPSIPGMKEKQES